jgi:hypothetical protein
MSIVVTLTILIVSVAVHPVSAADTGTVEASESSAVGPTEGRWTEPVALVEVNTATAEEWSPTLSPDGLTFYFGRVNDRESSWGRIFQATRPSPFSHFTSISELPGPLNDVEGHVHGQWVSPDELRLYYTWQPNGVFRLQVSERRSVGDPWPVGRDIPELNLLGDRLVAPRLTPDELTIVFSGPQAEGHTGNYDLWMATRSDRSMPFDRPFNLESLNSPFNDIHGFITVDGLELYLASDRNGRFQLFKAARQDANSPFGEPVLMSLFDTPDDNCRFPCLSADGTQFYFMRDAVSDRSTRDIYVSYRID